MRTYLTLTRRELGGMFLSWVGYVVVAGAVFLMGLSFVSLTHSLQSDATPSPVTEIFFLSFWFWLILLFSTPIITMRTFALEKSSGTFETLMTAPVSDLQVVLAKFTGSMIFYMLVWLPLLGCVAILSCFTHERGFLDPGILGSTYLGIFLLGALFVSAGCFASALTRNQIVAAMISFGAGLGLFLAGFMTERLALSKGWIAEVLGYMSIHVQMEEFARGVIDTRYVVFYLSLCVFFLFLTHRTVESRRWK